jgi:hypothetical protein
VADEIAIPRETARILFDALSTSMDFGSGFLDTEEVEALRQLAVLIGVDPTKGTPDTFVKHYPHAFKPMKHPGMLARIYRLIEPDDVLARIIGPEEVQRRNAELRPRFVPCQAGAYPYCQKPETDPIHGSAGA